MKAIKYRADIDGLRALAVLAVVAFHAFPKHLPGGFIGVDIFFVISGYLISSIILSSLDAGKFSFREFYARRIKRIFPALILVLAASLAVGWVSFNTGDYTELSRQVMAGAGFGANILFWTQNGYFDQAAELKPLLHLWSLGVEEQFYLLWPVVLVLLYRRRVHLVGASLLLIAVSFAVNIHIYHKYPSANFYLPASRFWELWAGFLLARLRLPPGGVWTRFAGPASLVGLAGLLAGMVLIHEGPHYPGWAALVPVLGTMLLIGAGERAWVNRYAMASRAMVGIGLISYPLYLWHWPLLSLVRVINHGGETAYLLRGGLVAAAFALAWLTYRFVEKPIRFGAPRRAKMLGLIGAMLAVSVSAGGIYLSKGAPIRYPKVMRALAGVTEKDFHLAENFRLDRCFIQAHRGNINYESCVEEKRPLVALWGDSAAGSLYPGLKALQEERRFGIAQMTHGGCPPMFAIRKLVFKYDCNEINPRILQTLGRAKPEFLIVHSAWWHPDFPMTEEELGTRARDSFARMRQAMPTTRILVVGPSPRWEPTPQAVLLKAWEANPVALPDPYQKALRLDKIEAILRGSAAKAGVEYVSAMKALCKGEVCIASVGPAPTDLIAVDGVHYTPAGARYFVAQGLGKILPGAAAR